MLGPGGDHYKWVAEGGDGVERGTWRDHVLYNIAVRDGDSEAVAAFEEKDNRLRRAWGVA